MVRARNGMAGAALVLLMAGTLPHAGTARADNVPTRRRQGTIFAALQNGYVYAGVDPYTWQEADNGLPSGTDITALAVAPDGNTVYAGTQGSGIYVSTDGGATWQDDNGGDTTLANAAVSALAIDPTQSATVFAVTADDSFYASQDSGASWRGSALPTSSPATSLAVNRRIPTDLLIGTLGAGIFRSQDGGDTWNGDYNADPGNVYALAFNPRSADVAYAAADHGIYQTIDGGSTWQADRRGIPGSASFQSIAVDPSNGARVLAGTTYGQLFRTQDGGTSWTYQADTTGTRVNTILFDPTRPGAVIAGTDDGSVVYRSYDSGGSWSHYNTGLDASNGVLVLAAAARTVVPTDPVAAPQANSRDARYFPETHHLVRGPFLAYYNANNGLKIFGLPLTEAFSEFGQTVQYFERSRLVYAHGRIAISLLGAQLTSGLNFLPARCCPPHGQLWFAQTRHTLAGRFLKFWRSHHGATLFGSPISQPLYEQNGDGTGRTYLVQYFEKARMEYHPELGGTGNVVTLGLLGKESLRQRGWL